ncbi:hypothetical protein H4W80_004568 [Nonomuraea angiospora]|uniref:Uncharacterized protein n=1 Tax=Nonomuraea angiospora TaxID=46172 RepID=A0ABR9M091_9ACTN|nr:hypothetical protein [Nonomuraea angiospora]
MIGRRAVPRRLPINGRGDTGARGSGAGCLASWGGAGRFLGARCSGGGWLGARWGAGGHADVAWRAGGHAGARWGAGGRVDVRWGAGGRVGACQGSGGRLERSIKRWRCGSLRGLVAAPGDGWAWPVRRASGWIGVRATCGSSASAPVWESVRTSAWASGSRGLRSSARVRLRARVSSLARVRAAGGGRWALVTIGLDRRWRGSLERLERPGRAPSGEPGVGRACGAGRIVRDSREGAR